MDPVAEMADVSLIPALEAYVRYQEEARGKSQAEVLRKVMRFWVDFARKKVREQHPGDAAKIRANLMTLTVQYSRAKRRFKGKRANEMRGTVAAAIIGFLNYKGARDLQRARSAEYYRVARQFVNARAFSSNAHQAGFIPAQRALRMPPGGVAPNYRKHPMGRIDDKLNEEIASILVENFAEARDIPGRPPALGIGGLVPGAFSDALPEVIRQFEQFLYDDLQAVAEKAGFKTTRKAA